MVLSTLSELRPSRSRCAICGSLHTARFPRFSPHPHCTGASPLQPVAHPRAAHAHDCDLPDLLLLLLLLPCSFALKLVQVEPPAPYTISEGAPSVESESRDNQQAARPTSNQLTFPLNWHRQ